MADLQARHQKELDEQINPDKTKIASEVIEQRNASLQYQTENYYDQWAEIYRNIHARTVRKTFKDERGEDKDDPRTNICVPDHFVMHRRGTARMTRNAPDLRVTGGDDTPQGQAARNKVSAKLMWQWDRSEAQREFKKITASAYAFGIGVGYSFYDEVNVVRQLQRLTATLDRRQFMALGKQPDDVIGMAVNLLGDKLQPDEIAAALAKYGPRVTMPVNSSKYNGPTMQHVFIGDVFWEPGMKNLNDSGYITESRMETEQFLEYWQNRQTINPFTGEKTAVFADPDAMDKCLEQASSNPRSIDSRLRTLRRWMREEIGKADPDTTTSRPAHSSVKRFQVDIRHTFVGGHLCMDFIGCEGEYLGRMWYPWETYGSYLFTQMVLIPDLLEGVGLSTPIVSRFLLQLRNTRWNQITDFINNKLLPLMGVRDLNSYGAMDLIRTMWGRLVQRKQPGDLNFINDPVMPPEAWSDQNALQQQMGMVDPTSTSLAPGNSDTPLIGKFATTAKLEAQSTDSLTSDMLDYQGNFIRDTMKLWLWFNQQAASSEDTVPESYLSRAGVKPPSNPADTQKYEAAYGLSARTEDGSPRLVRILPMDWQNELQVQPEQGSTLATNDEYRIKGLQQFLQLGMGHPEIINLRAVFTKLADATPGVNSEDVILPPPPPQPPTPPVKMNISLSVKWDELPADVQTAILQHEGLPTHMTHVEGVGKLIERTSDAADAASNLEAPVDHTSVPAGKNGHK